MDMADLTFTERVFLRMWCKAPPAAPFEPRDTFDPTRPPPVPPNPLMRMQRVYGERFMDAIKGKTVLDLGCGAGHQVIGAAEAGAALAVGVDKQAISIALAKSLAESRRQSDTTRFTTDTVTTFGTAWADVAMSQNSFEHFKEPAGILQQAYAALKPGGQFFVTFGPSWWHPFGVHHMFMIRLPWAHALFSERTILRVRQLYRPNTPTCWSDTGLNQMTVAKFLRLVDDSQFTLSRLSFTPIGPLPKPLVTHPLFREWTTSDTSVILTKAPAAPDPSPR